MKNRSDALTLIEMIVVLVVIAVLAGLLLPSMTKARSRAQRIACVGRLKQISLGAKQWALDHTNSYPISLSTNFGGTREWLSSGETFRHLVVMSNELNSPLVLVCPSDRERRPARDFTSLASSNLSYFVGLDATDEYPQMILFGDRNIFSGIRPANGVVGFTTNSAIVWGPGPHNGVGNVALTDGSVQQLTSSRMRDALENTGVQTNWVQLP